MTIRTTVSIEVLKDTWLTYVGYQGKNHTQDHADVSISCDGSATGVEAVAISRDESATGVA